MKNKVDTYEDLLDESPLVEKILTRQLAEAMFTNNDYTVANLQPVWFHNMKENLPLYKKYGSITDSFYGFGINKAIIAVGGGPSFNINKDFLKYIYEWNLQFPLEDQPFIIVSTNKQFKSLLEMNIFPHLVLLIDAGDALHDQLCEGIPEFGRKSVLLTGLHASPKILRSWIKQGGQICFYFIGDDKEKKLFEKETGDDVEKAHIAQGGNILNTLWILSNRFFGSKIYITVGNDLSFEYLPEKAEREKAFYADGDYRYNILNKRDEAKDLLGWMGFTLEESQVILGRLLYNLQIMGTSKQFWVYKTWMEVQAAMWADKYNYHYYNCSEKGILGVLAHDTSSNEAMFDRSNWYLLDELLPRRWHTTTLKRAFFTFLKARNALCQMQEGILTGVRGAGPSPLVTDGAKGIVLH